MVIFALAFSAIFNAKSEEYSVTMADPAEADYWTNDSTYYKTDWLGAGSIDDPYEISSPEHLAGLAYQVNNGTSYTGQYFIQTTNLDMSAHVWMPIGSMMSSNAFAGCYDGGNFEITGLNIYENAMEAGLFGQLNGTVINTRVVDCTFNLSPTEYQACVGIIAAGSTTGCTIVNCYTDCEVNIHNAAKIVAGGILGNAITEVTNPAASSNVADCVSHTSITYSLLDLSSAMNNASDFLVCVGGIAGQAINVNFLNCTSYGNLQGDNSPMLDYLDLLAAEIGPEAADYKDEILYVYGSVMQSCTGGIVGMGQGRILSCSNHGNITNAWMTGGIVGVLRMNDFT